MKCAINFNQKKARVNAPDLMKVCTYIITVVYLNLLLLLDIKITFKNQGNYENIKSTFIVIFIISLI